MYHNRVTLVSKFTIERFEEKYAMENDQCQLGNVKFRFFFKNLTHSLR